jgi:hypothetical protein
MNREDILARIAAGEISIDEGSKLLNQLEATQTTQRTRAVRSRNVPLRGGRYVERPPRSPSNASKVDTSLREAEQAATGIVVTLALRSPTLNSRALHGLIRRTTRMRWNDAERYVSDLEEGNAVAFAFHDTAVARNFLDCASKLGDWATIELINRRTREELTLSQGILAAMLLLAFSIAEIWLWAKFCAWAWRGAKTYDGFGSMSPLWGFVAILALPCIVIAQVMFYYTQWREQRDYSRRRTEPCQHGVAGAAYRFVPCSTCDVERATDEEVRVECFKRLKQHQDADKQRVAEELAERRKREAAEAAAKRERDRAEFLRNIRLPNYLREMHPRRFELLICALFRKWGYGVEETP